MGARQPAWEGEMEERDDRELSLEETFSEIESIIGMMEQPDVSLDDSFSLYERGVAQLARCTRMLDAVEKKLVVLSGEGEQEGGEP